MNELQAAILRFYIMSMIKLKNLNYTYLYILYIFIA